MQKYRHIGGFLLSGSPFHVFTSPRFAVEILNLSQVGRRIIDFAPTAAVSPPSALAVPVLTPDSASMVLALPSIAMIVGAAELCRGDYKKASALTSQQDGATKSLWMLAVTPTVSLYTFCAPLVTSEM